MAFLSDETVERVKEAVNIVDLVGDYVDLKRTGKNHKGLCPFHQEKTPSFIVTEERGTFKCFGCQEHGDAIAFIMKIEQLDFADAVRFLAKRYGIPIIENEKQSLRQSRFNQLYEINKQAMLFYYKELLTNRIPQNYLKSRQMNSSIINDFFLGYAGGGGNSLYRHLHELGFEDSDLLHLGLISKSNRGTGYYDRFRNRLIFPIISKRNKIIGFGGRSIGNDQPKYLNSPESDIFQKGDHLYGIHRVQKRRDSDRVLLVEGYMDVIALNMHGIDYALASLGTALTPNQAKLANRYGKKVYLCYDGDGAGIKASRRATEVFKEIDVIPKMILLPEGKDPDDYCKAYGSESFLAQMDKAVDPIEFELRLMEAGYDLDQEKEKLDYILEVTDFLAGIDQEAIRDVYIRQVAGRVQVAPESLKNDILAKEDRIRRMKAEEEERRRKIRSDPGLFPPADDFPMPDYIPYEEDFGDDEVDHGEMPVEEDFHRPTPEQSEMGNSKERRLQREREGLEFELVRLARNRASCREILAEEISGFAKSSDTKKILATILSLCDHDIPPEFVHLRNSLKDEDSLRLMKRLEESEQYTQNLSEDRWRKNALELQIRIRSLLLRERRQELIRQIQEYDQASSESDKTKEDLLGELLLIDTKLKGEKLNDRPR